MFGSQSLRPVRGGDSQPAHPPACCDSGLSAARISASDAAGVQCQDLFLLSPFIHSILPMQYYVYIFVHVYSLYCFAYIV